MQHLCSVLWSHTAGVCTAPWGFACHTFNQLRVTSCCSIIHTAMDGCRVWMPISRAVHVQLQALYVHRAPVFSFLDYLHPLLILCVGWLNFFSVLVTNKGCLGDRVTKFIYFTEMFCLLPVEATDAVNIRILRVNNKRG